MRVFFLTTESTEATEKDDSGGFLTDSRLPATGYRSLLLRLMKSGKPASLGRYSWAKVVLPAPVGPAMMTILGDSAALFFLGPDCFLCSHANKDLSFVR
jgi:hypothetical protein